MKWPGFRHGHLPPGTSLRILYVLHQFYPEYHHGTEKFVLQAAQAAQRSGHRVRVATYRVLAAKGRAWVRRRDRPVIARTYRHEGVSVVSVRLPRQSPDYYQWLQDNRLTAFAGHYMTRFRPQVVHVGHAMRMTEFVWAAQEMHLPTIVTLTDYWLLCPKITLLNSRGERCDGPAGGAACARDCPDLPAGLVAARLPLAHRLLSGASRIAAPSRFLREVFLREWAGLNIRVIRHGVPRWTTNTRQPRADAPLVIAYAGSLNRHKGVHTLIEALSGVTGSNIRLQIWGDGPDAAAFRRMAADDARITFGGIYGPEQAPAVFGGMDLLVAPSLWYENNPFVVNEALACGVPVIASAAGGMAEAVRDGLNGLLVPPGDVTALRAILQRLANDPGQVNALKAGVQPDAIPTPAQEAAAYALLYREVTTR
jgi:glycosyltransferase involved in cell wall biosynthesis